MCDVGDMNYSIICSGLCHSQWVTLNYIKYNVDTGDIKHFRAFELVSVHPVAYEYSLMAGDRWTLWWTLWAWSLWFEDWVFEVPAAVSSPGRWRKRGNRSTFPGTCMCLCSTKTDVILSASHSQGIGCREVPYWWGVHVR